MRHLSRLRPRGPEAKPRPPPDFDVVDPAGCAVLLLDQTTNWPHVSAHRGGIAHVPGGVYRRTDGGVTWMQLSGAPGTGLPAERAGEASARAFWDLTVIR
jgi:hypothetical protein